MPWVKVIEDIAAFNFHPFSSKKIRYEQHLICLVRLDDQSFKAIADTCSHDGASLSLGEVKSNQTVSCPWHHYLFDLNTGKCVNHNCASLTTYETKIENGDLYLFIA